MRKKEQIVKNKILAVCKSFLWCIVVLLFPIMSGTLSAILSLNTVQTLFLQGSFMVCALIPPVVLVIIGKWSLKEIVFPHFDFQVGKWALYFIPLLVIFVPPALKGFYIKSPEYVFGSLFLYLFVGISEEVYFRGIIPKYLKECFSEKEIILLSSFVFAIGHIASAFSCNSVFEVILSIFNAFIFGWMAIEIVIFFKSIIPAILIHFFFDFETKIVVMKESELLIAETVRGALMLIMAIWLAVVIKKEKEKQVKEILK